MQPPLSPYNLDDEIPGEETPTFIPQPLSSRDNVNSQPPDQSATSKPTDAVLIKFLCCLCQQAGFQTAETGALCILKQLTVKYMITSAKKKYAEHYGQGQTLLPEQTIAPEDLQATIPETEDDIQQSDCFSISDQDPNVPASTDTPRSESRILELEPDSSPCCSCEVFVKKSNKGLASAADYEEINRIRQTLMERDIPPRRHSSVIIDRFGCMQELRPGRLPDCKRPKSTSFFDTPVRPTLKQAIRKENLLRERPTGVGETIPVRTPLIVRLPVKPTLIARPALPKITLVKNNHLDSWTIKRVD